MTAPTHAWLRRLSDYHSGGVSAAERIAVEAHLATCAECQEALAMYRRFYTLLRSPLRLGGPSAHFDEPTTILDVGSSRSQLEWRPGGPARRGPRSRRTLAGVAAALAAVLVIAGFIGVFATRLHPPSVAATPTAQPSATPQPTSAAEPTASPQPSGTPQPGAFVCANPQGSSMTYAYIRGDGNVYAVTGCNAPRQLTSTYATPVAWSPSNRLLAVWVQSYPAPDKVAVIDTQTGATIATPYAIDFGRTPNIGSTARIFFGWLDDTTFLGAIAPLVNGTPPANVDAPGTSTLVRVDLHTGKETTLGTIPGWVVFGPNGWEPGVKVAANGHDLFFAAYQGSTAYLHRFDLTAGTDTTLVSLGLYGNGGCQGSIVCGWTAPWDVSPDGSHILYHHPGAASTPSDISVPKDTPVLYANPDGSGASMPFGTQLAGSLVTPVFSPNGAMAVTTGSTYVGTNPSSGPPPQMKLVTFGGGSATIVPGALSSWRGDDRALVIFGPQASTALYDLSSGKTTQLEVNSNFYLWGHY